MYLKDFPQRLLVVGAQHLPDAAERFLDKGGVAGLA